MSDLASDPEDPIIHAIRFRERARRDATAAFVQIAETASETRAQAWYEGLLAAVATLASGPRRNPLAPERFHGETRRLLYRRSKDSPAYHIYFTIEGEGAETLESPTVIIRHVRHAAAKPLTKREIRQIEAAK